MSWARLHVNSGRLRPFALRFSRRPLFVGPWTIVMSTAQPSSPASSSANWGICVWVPESLTCLVQSSMITQPGSTRRFRCRACMPQGSQISIRAYLCRDERLWVFVLLQFQTVPVNLGTPRRTTLIRLGTIATRLWEPIDPVDLIISPFLIGVSSVLEPFWQSAGYRSVRSVCCFLSYRIHFRWHWGWLFLDRKVRQKMYVVCKPWTGQ